ncbi:MAG: NAD-dependent epimerase/dehydratase family protein [Lachnospiraceae bacterium]|nr:NAD-dependent epimerase/dehydratase family protein [Lachnospiraceae bacterium]
MNVLITGSEGFIGGRLVDHYLRNGDDVYGWGLEGFYRTGGDYIKKSLMSPGDVREVLDRYRPDLLLHCAGSADVNLSVKKPMWDLENNYITTHNLLFALKSLEMTKCRFVLFSSAAVYGNPVSLPMDEEQPINPLSPYALHKRAAEETTVFMHRNYGLDTKILRIFSVYGAGLKKQIFWDMYRKYTETGRLELWGSGEESRDYIYVDDLVKAVSLVAERSGFDDLVFNVANGRETTIREAAHCFGEAFGIDPELISFLGVRREGDPINWRADITKLSKLGYTQSISFEEGVRKYVDWVKNGTGVLDRKCLSG